MRVKEVYLELARAQLTSSQVQFSEIWLGRSKRYYSHLIAAGREPGLGTLVSLSHRLRRTLAAMDDCPLDAKRLSGLAAELDRHIEVRSSLTRQNRQRADFR